jgi:anti-sigma-K factor RskA
MSAIDHDRAEALAAMSAAGGATAEEIQELNALCVQSSEIAELVRSYEHAATALALGLPAIEPPPGTLDAIRRRIADGPAVGTASVTSLDEHRARARGERQRWPQIMAVLATAAAVALGVSWTRERQTVAELEARVADAETRIPELESRSEELSSRLADERRQRAAIENELASAQRRVEHIQSPSLQLATLRASEAPRAPSAKVFIDPENRRWLVLAYDLPPIDPSRQDYQLWYIPRTEGAAPLPAGLLQHTGDGVYEAAIDLPPGVDVGHAAISLEKKGGVEVPTDVKMAGPVL